MLRRDDLGEDRASRFLGRWLRGGEVRSGDRLASSQRDEALTIAIASGKGGTGKSFFATSLAIALCEPLVNPRLATEPTVEAVTLRKRRIGLVDCDFGMACDHLLLGVRPEKTLHHIVGGGAHHSDIAVHTTHGPVLLPGGSGIQRLADLGRTELAILGSEIGSFVREQDVVLFDIGAGIAPHTVVPMTCADQVILVTNAEIAALTDAYAVIKCLSAQCRRAPFSIVINRVTEPGQGEVTFQKLAEVAGRFSDVALQYLGEIPDDPAVTQRRLGQAPLIASDPQCATSQAILKIRDRLRSIVGNYRPRSVDSSVGFTRRFHAALDSIR